MKFDARTRLVIIALAAGLDPLAAFEMAALDFAKAVQAARARRWS